jgi:hypothetical protein
MFEAKEVVFIETVALPHTDVKLLVAVVLLSAY